VYTIGVTKNPYWTIKGMACNKSLYFTANEAKIKPSPKLNIVVINNANGK
jgi:hypothetical protein